MAKPQKNSGISQNSQPYGTNTILAARWGKILALFTAIDLFAYPVGFAILPRCANDNLFGFVFATLCALNLALFLLSSLLMLFSDAVRKGLAASPRPTAAAEGSLMSATYTLSKTVFFLAAVFLIILIASELHLESLRRAER